MVLTASPVGSPLKKYEPAPFATADFANSPLAQFSPDNRSILLMIDVTGGRQAWLLPYPPGKGQPRRDPRKSAEHGLHAALVVDPRRRTTPSCRWSPNADSTCGSVGMHAGLKRQITANITAQNNTQPALSPAGDKLLFVQ